MQPSTWTKWISTPGNIRAVALDASALVRELILQQGLKGIAQKGLADAVVGSLLISSSHKSNESINMNAKGSGPFRQAIIDASPEGRVRGFLIEETERSKQAYVGSGYWGRGLLSILYTKNFEGKQPYTGMVPISTGFLDDAINDYYRDSEQLASNVGFHIDFSDGEVRTARGVLVQAMGGASEEELALARSLDAKALGRLAASFTTPADIDFSSLMPTVIFKAVETTPLVKFCTCSQERIERALILTGEASVVDALGTDPALEITCDFCRTTYYVTAERIRSIFSQGPVQ